MRKHIFPRLKTLLGAACATLYTRQANPAMPKFSPEPRRRPEDDMPEHGLDAWMFEAETELQRSALSRDMNALADSLGSLRTTLSLISGESPYPVEAMTQAPCAIVHHDDVLFDGEPEVTDLPMQDTTIGGESTFLFGDWPDYEDQPVQQHAA